MDEPRHDRLTELDAATCQQLLASRDVGRIAFNADPSPEVLPVNYALRDGAIVFHTATGAKLSAAQRQDPATFEVDGVDSDRRTAWSVIVRGTLKVADETDYADLPEPLPAGERPHLVRLTINRITGRRIPAVAGWARAMAANIWTGREASDLMG